METSGTANPGSPDSARDRALAFDNYNAPTSAPALHRKSHAGTGILSRLPFLRTAPPSTENRQRLGGREESAAIPNSPDAKTTLPDTPAQQSRTRRRKGSLRKVALLGRGSRDRDHAEERTVGCAPSPGEAGRAGHQSSEPAALNADSSRMPAPATPTTGSRGGGSRRNPDNIAGRESGISAHPANTAGRTNNQEPSTVAPGRPYGTSPAHRPGPAIPYPCTTDEEDLICIPKHKSAATSAAPQSSDSESFLPHRLRHRSIQRAKSPLSCGGLSASPVAPEENVWDYSETEWWGWVVLVVTWFVFVIGMGSCLGVWSWAWDVGTTPYAPPELEDDPTLPIVGYYPALIILSCIMAWVWVVAAWVGMKYFRHAKISGD